MTVIETPHSPNVLTSRIPPGTLPHNYKALLLCISYNFRPDGSDLGNRLRPLGGPLNDAKEMKTSLIGGA